MTGRRWFVDGPGDEVAFAGAAVLAAWVITLLLAAGAVLELRDV